MKKPNAPNHAALTLLFSFFVFCILAITMIIVGAILYLLSHAGLLDEMNSFNRLFMVAVFVLVSIMIGMLVAKMVSRVPLSPLNKLIDGMNRLAGGKYETRIHLGRNPIGEELSKGFNLLAGELQNTEMLRSDFVNNFSHEFKTPIVSIRGFARLLQKEALSKKQREYVEIIAEESGRLADMATNILNLAKVENQSILADISRFNLSEQLRNCILLFEGKWSQKSLKIAANFGEYEIDASEELLKQVWINIIDNAVKFSPPGGEIDIDMRRTPGMITVSIKNNGDSISEEDKNRIFQKFYQGDTSHSSEGTGIGLAIAKRITELHGGAISVAGTSGETTFTVALPTA